MISNYCLSVTHFSEVSGLETTQTRPKEAGYTLIPDKEGDRKDNVHGTLVSLADGESWKGEWKNGKLHGKVKQVFPNKDCFEGEFSEGLPNGYGKVTSSTGKLIAEGEWKNGALHGKGIQLLPNGDRYEGNFFDGSLNDGKLIRSKGEYYEGGWENGMPHGSGIYLYSNGDRYEGEITEGCPNGHGKMTFSLGGSYEGEWKYGERCGKGIVFTPNGKRHEVSYLHSGELKVKFKKTEELKNKLY